MPDANDDAAPSLRKRALLASRKELKRLVRSSVPLTCGVYVVLDAMSALRRHIGNIGTESGSTHSALSIDESVRYVEQVTQKYMDAAGLSRFSGTVAEIGPGDNLGVALLMLARGASEVHAIDRFRSARNDDVQSAIYRALSTKHGLSAFFDGPPAERNIRGVRYICGVAAEEFFAQNPKRYDAVVSNAVMEHLLDPIVALDRMLGALNPGGKIVHQIDLRDHGMFVGRHPLTFLTVPKPLYRRMVANSGRPNRILIHRYKVWAQKANLDCRFLVTGVAGDDAGLAGPTPWESIDPDVKENALAEIRKMRRRFAREFRDVADADLAVTSFMMVATKSLRAP
jgi:SAM-dependent methyltransferase